MTSLCLAMLTTGAASAQEEKGGPSTGAFISGRVVAKDDRPVRMATVLAFPRMTSPDAELPQMLIGLTSLEKITSVPPASTLTDAAGAFRIPGLEPRWYSLRIVANGFSPASEDAVEAPAQGVRIVLPPGGTLGGVVRDPSGKAVAAAVVEAYPEPESNDIFEIIRAKSRPPVQSVRSEATGEFLFRRLGRGLYNFRVSAAKFQTHAEARIPVAPGDTRNFTLQPGKVLRGVVRGPDGEPLAGARVRVTPSARRSGREAAPVRIQFSDESVLTDPHGVFFFDTLNDGEHSLLAWHPDHAAVQLRAVRPSGDDLAIRLSRGKKIEGRVVDATTGKPVPGARVSAPDLADIQKEATSDAKGEYTISGLGPGRRRSLSVSVRAVGYAPLKSSVSSRGGDTIVKNFELVPTGSVQGRAVGNGGGPLAGARVEVRRASGKGLNAVQNTIGEATTDSTGRFVVGEVEPGSGLRAWITLSGYLVRYTDAFAVQSRQVTDLGEILLEEGGTIEGRVLSPGERPVRACVVKALESGATVTTKVARTDERGHYKLSGLQKRTFALDFEAPDFLPARREGLEVLPGRTTRVPAVVLEPGRTLAGRVLSSTGQAVVGAEVVVLDTGKGFVRHSATTGGSGAFRFSAITSEAFVSVEVHHAEYTERTLEKVAVGEQNLEIVLRALGRISGRVTDREGQPLTSFSVLPATRGKPSSMGPKLRARTFTDGRFEYAGLASGTYDLQVRAPGLAPTTVRGVEVKLEQVVDLGAIVLEPERGGTGSGSARDVVPLPHAHAHNDYEHERPLLDALDHGFTSVEADIYLVEGRLLVAHDLRDVKPKRTLQRLYLDPLLQRVRKNGGRVHARAEKFTLLIDLKSDGEKTYAALNEVLAKYAEMLTTVKDGKVKRKAITIVISGNRPRDLIAGGNPRYAGIDGRLSDLDSELPAHLLPMISDRWGSHFKWRGEGEIPAEDRTKLIEAVRKAHASGRSVRFWATPEKPAVWKVLHEAGVDHINTDRLAELERFLLERRKKKSS